MKVALQMRLVDSVVDVEGKVEWLEEEMDICMGQLDQLFARPNRSLFPARLREKMGICMGQLDHLLARVEGQTEVHLQPG